jgi:hypothetical protein
MFIDGCGFKNEGRENHRKVSNVKIKRKSPREKRKIRVEYIY